MKIEGSVSGSISQRHGSANPDPHQNVMDPHGSCNCSCSRCYSIFQFLHMLLVLGSIPTFASVYTGVTGNCCSCFCGLFPAVSVKTAFNAVAVDLTFLLMLWLLLPSLLLLYLFSNSLFLLSCCLFLPFYGFFLSFGSFDL
jgi:hypothetical protein